MRSFSLDTIIGFFLFFAPIQYSGQTTFKDSSEVYQYWAERGTIEMIYSYMEDLNPESNIEKKGRDKFKAEFVDNIEKMSRNEINSAFETLEQFLNENGWPATSKNIYKPLRTNYHNSNNIDSSFFQINGKGKEYKNKGNNCFKTQEKIIRSYQSALHNFNKSNVQEEPIYTKKSGIINNERSQEERDINKIWKIILYPVIFIFGFISGFIMIFIFIKKQIFSTIEYEKQKYLNELNEIRGYFPKWLGVIEILKRSKDHYKKESEKNNNLIQREIVSLRQENQKLKNDNELLKSENERLEKQLDETKFIENSQNEVNIESLKPSFITMYFSMLIISVFQKDRSKWV